MKPYFNLSRPKAKYQTSIYLQGYIKSEKFTLPLEELKIAPKDWNQKRQRADHKIKNVIQKQQQDKLINDQLESTRNEVNEKYLEYINTANQVSAKGFKQFLTKKVESTEPNGTWPVYDFFYHELLPNKRVGKKKLPISKKTRKSYVVSLKKVSAFYDLYRKENLESLKNRKDLNRLIGRKSYHEFYNELDFDITLDDLNDKLLMKKFFLWLEKFNYAINAFGNNHKIITAKFSKKGKTVFQERIAIKSKIQHLKETRNDDLQALIAVHESGHAVLSIVLLHTYPEEIFSQSTDSERIGYTVSNFNFTGLPRHKMLNRVAFLLGGIVAEELVYGKENITSGSGSDIEEATAFVADMIRSCGMGETQASIQTRSHRTVRQLQDDRTNGEIRKWMTEAREIAMASLKKHQPLLLEFSNYLADHRTIKKSQIEEVVKCQYPEIHGCVVSRNSFHNYREVLKGQTVISDKRTHIPQKKHEIHLNMDRNGQ